MLAFSSPFQKALGIWNPGKVLRLVFELLRKNDTIFATYAVQKLVHSWGGNQYYVDDFICDNILLNIHEDWWLNMASLRMRK